MQGGGKSSNRSNILNLLPKALYLDRRHQQLRAKAKQISGRQEGVSPNVMKICAFSDTLCMTCCHKDLRHGGRMGTACRNEARYNHAVATSDRFDEQKLGLLCRLSAIRGYATGSLQQQHHRIDKIGTACECYGHPGFFSE